MMKSLSILLVDDDEIERMKFKKVCSDNSFICSIIEAENGSKALSLLQDVKNSFNIIILDLHMPTMNGLELLKKIKSSSIYKSIPIIIMSNSEDNNELKQCYELGVSGYFTKPAHYAKYAKKVKSLLKYWKRNELIS